MPGKQSVRFGCQKKKTFPGLLACAALAGPPMAVWLVGKRARDTFFGDKVARHIGVLLLHDKRQRNNNCTSPSKNVLW